VSEVARNLAIARSLWRAATEGDPEPVLEFDPKVVWRTYGTSANAGEFHGLDAVLRYLASVGERAEDQRSDLIDVLASERAAVIHFRTVARRGPNVLDSQQFLWLRIEDGVVREVAAVPWDQAASAEFFRLD